jgi:hypothetical protein
MNILGWVGSFCVVGVYALNSYQLIKSDSFTFYALNIAGGVLLIIFSVYKTVYPNVFINAVWVVIAVVGIIRASTKQRAS